MLPLLGIYISSVCLKHFLFPVLIIYPPGKPTERQHLAHRNKLLFHVPVMKIPLSHCFEAPGALLGVRGTYGFVGLRMNMEL